LFTKEETPSETENKTTVQQGLVEGGSEDTGNKQKDKNSVVNKTISDLKIQTEEFGSGYFSKLQGAITLKDNKIFATEVSKLEETGGIDFSGIGDIKDNVEKIFEEIDGAAAEVDDDGLPEDAKLDLKDINEQVDFNINGELKELATETTLEKINTSPIKSDKSNWQMLNVVIPIELSMTIDGVGGLEPGDVFRVDYLPELYRKYAFFQIFTINHSISQGGWDTKITAKMRLNNEKMIKDGLIVLIEPVETPPPPELEFRTSGLEFDTGAFAPRFDVDTGAGTAAGRSRQENQAEQSGTQAGGGNVYRQTPVVGQGPQT
jgi:hypothetical protein